MKSISVVPRHCRASCCASELSSSFVVKFGVEVRPSFVPRHGAGLLAMLLMAVLARPSLDVWYGPNPFQHTTSLRSGHSRDLRARPDFYPNVLQPAMSWPDLAKRTGVFKIFLDMLYTGIQHRCSADWADRGGPAARTAHWHRGRRCEVGRGPLQSHHRPRLRDHRAARCCPLAFARWKDRLAVNRPRRRLERAWGFGPALRATHPDGGPHRGGRSGVRKLASLPWCGASHPNTTGPASLPYSGMWMASAGAQQL